MKNEQPTAGNQLLGLLGDLIGVFFRAAGSHAGKSEDLNIEGQFARDSAETSTRLSSYDQEDANMAHNDDPYSL